MMDWSGTMLDWSATTATNTMSTDQMPSMQDVLAAAKLMSERFNRVAAADVIVVDADTDRRVKDDCEVVMGQPAEHRHGFPGDLYGVPYEVYPNKHMAQARTLELIHKFGKKVCCVTQPERE